MLDMTHNLSYDEESKTKNGKGGFLCQKIPIPEEMNFIALF